MFVRNFLFVACVLGPLVNAVTLKKCQSSDEACVLESFRSAFKDISAGIPELGVETSDPMVVKQIYADVAGLKYNFSDVTMKGYKDCVIDSVKVNLDKNEISTKMYCKFDMRGKYILKGRLLVLPVEGEGDFTIFADKMQLTVNAELQKTEGKDGKTHFTIKKYTFEQDALEQVTFDFKNLFNGNKELSDPVHKFANENYKDVTKELSSPIFNAALKKFSKNANKFLKSVPIEDILP